MHVINGFVHEVCHNLWRVVFWIWYQLIILHRSQVYNYENLLLHRHKKICISIIFHVCTYWTKWRQTKTKRDEVHVLLHFISNPNKALQVKVYQVPSLLASNFWSVEFGIIPLRWIKSICPMICIW
jgi:hypothetical protein